MIPPEVLELIFANLPILDIINCSLVCKLWCSVVCNPHFMPWRRVYMYMKIRSNALYSSPLSKSKKLLYPSTILEEYLKSFNINAKFIKTFFINSIRFLGRAHESPKDYGIIGQLFNSHRLFESADRLLNYVSEIGGMNSFNLWHYVAAIVILSENEWDNSYAIHLLLSSIHLSNLEVYEALYSLAFLFLYGAKNCRLSLRYHYNLCAALHYHEHFRDIDHLSSPEISLGELQLRLNLYQLQIIKHDFQKKQIIKIDGFSGSGKTTILSHIANKNTDWRVLLVVPDNWETKRPVVSFPPNTSVKKVRDLLQAKKNESLSWDLCRLSTPDTINDKSDELITSNSSKSGNSTPDTAKDSSSKALNHRRKSDSLPYDLILVDDGHRMRGKELNLFRKFDLPVVIAGDSCSLKFSSVTHKNHFESLKSDHEFFLNESFEVNSEVAFIANNALQMFLKHSARTVISGINSRANVLPANEVLSQMTYVCRNRFEMFSLAASFSINSERTLSVGIFGGFEKLNLQEVSDIFQISQLEKGKIPSDKLDLNNKNLIHYKTVSSLSQIKDKDFEISLKVFSKYREYTLDFIKRIKCVCNSDTSEVDVVITCLEDTWHTKWDTVIAIADLSQSTEEDFRFLYSVAMRAKRITIIPSLCSLLEGGNKFETLTRTTQIRCGTDKCLECQKEFEQPLPPFITKIRLIEYESMTEKPSVQTHLICNTCTSEQFSFSSSSISTVDWSRISRRCFISGSTL